MGLQSQSLVTWKAILTLAHVTSFSISSLRLLLRFRKHQFWYDDYLAGLVLVLEAVFYAIVWLGFNEGYTTQTHSDTLYSFSLSLIMYFAVMWISRISLTLSLARIFCAGHGARRMALSLCALCTLFWVLNIIFSVTTCRSGETLLRMQPSSCLVLGKGRGARETPVYTVVSGNTDLMADILLFVCPYMVFRRIKLSPRERRFIIAVFSGSGLTIIALILISVLWRFFPGFLGTNFRLLLCVIANLAAVAAVVACNLPVVAMFLYAKFKNEGGRPERTTVTKTTTRAHRTHPVPQPNNNGVAPASDNTNLSRSQSRPNGDLTSRSVFEHTTNPSLDLTSGFSSVVTPYTLTQFDTGDISL